MSFIGIKNIDYLLKIAAQFTVNEIYPQLLKKLKKQNRDLSFDDYISLIKIDPTYGDGQEPGSYTNWIIKQFLNDPKTLTEDSEKLYEHLQIFHINKNKLSKKDITQYQSDADLFEAILPYLDSDLRSKRQREKEESTNYKIVHKDAEWTIYTPLTWEASVSLGRGTNWCTAADSEDGKKYFEQYNADDPLYILINNNDPTQKYQFHFDSKQFMDSADRDIDIGHALNRIFSYEVKDWFIDKLGVAPYDIELTGKISDDIMPLYDSSADLSISTDLLENMLRFEYSYKDKYTIDGMVNQLDIYPKDNIDLSTFNYDIVYKVVMKLFADRLRIAERYGMLSVGIQLDDDRYYVLIDEETVMSYFIDKVINNERISYNTLVDGGFVSPEIEAISTDEVKELYKIYFAEAKEKIYEEAGQLQLFEDSETSPEEKIAYIGIRSIDHLLELFNKIARIVPSVTNKLDADLETLTEWEYKYHKILNAPNLHPKRKENILNKIEVELEPITGYIIESLQDVYIDWLNKHALLSPRDWAEARLDYAEFEAYGAKTAIESTKNEYKRYGGRNFETKFFMTNINYFKDTIGETLDFEIDDTRYMLEESEKQNNTEEMQQYQAKLNYLENLDLNNETDLIEFTNNDTYVYLEDSATLLLNHPDLYDMLIDFLEKEIFPLWFDRWEAEGIVDTRENIEELYSKLQEAQSTPLKQKMVIISEALNAAHQTGSMLDYISNKHDNIDKKFLDSLSNKDVSQWDEELKEMGVW